MRGLLIGAGLLLGCSIALAAQDAKAENGVKLFAAKKCSTCHSVAGKGNPKGKLDGVGAKLSAAEIRQWIVSPAEMTEKTKATRKPAMKVTPTASGDVDALVAYLSTLKQK